MKSMLASVLVLISVALLAQNIPVNPNVTDVKGLRQGIWTICFNEKWKVTSNIDSIIYYRIIEYKNDKPVGVVKGYYKSGVLQMEASFIADRPKAIIDQSKPSRFFSESGQPVIAA